MFRLLVACLFFAFTASARAQDAPAAVPQGYVLVPIAEDPCLGALQQTVALDEELRQLKRKYSDLKPWWMMVGAGMAPGVAGGALLLYALASSGASRSPESGRQFRRKYWSAAGVAIAIPFSIGFGGAVYGVRHREERDATKRRLRAAKREVRDLRVWRKQHCYP